MIRSEGPDRADVSETLLILLRNTGVHSSNFVSEALDTPGINGQYGGTDGRRTLIAIMQSLVVLTGSETAAVEWLYHSRGYTAVAGDDAHLALENGDFWSLAVMQDWLRILETHRLICPELIDAIFGDSVS